MILELDMVLMAQQSENIFGNTEIQLQYETKTIHKNGDNQAGHYNGWNFTHLNSCIMKTLGIIAMLLIALALATLKIISLLGKAVDEKERLED